MEAATEKFEIKSQLFRELDRICRPEIILATNTSSISITKLAALTQRPERFVGMHFFNPVPVMKLVEVSAAWRRRRRRISGARPGVEAGEDTGEVNDFPGFVSNRVLMPIINEAIFAVMEGVATPEAVEK